MFDYITGVRDSPNHQLRQWIRVKQTQPRAPTGEFTDLENHVQRSIPSNDGEGEALHMRLFWTWQKLPTPGVGRLLHRQHVLACNIPSLVRT